MSFSDYGKPIHPRHAICGRIVLKAAFTSDAQLYRKAGCRGVEKGRGMKNPWLCENHGSKVDALLGPTALGLHPCRALSSVVRIQPNEVYQLIASVKSVGFKVHCLPGIRRKILAGVWGRR